MPTLVRSLLVTICLSGSVAWSQEKGKPAPEAMTGLDQGTPAPRFMLKDQDGRDRSLDEFLKKGKVALVFTRSADW